MKILIIGGTGTISSASSYYKPAASHIITEGATLANPYWEYSRKAHPTLHVEDPEFDAWCDRVIEAQEQARNALR